MKENKVKIFKILVLIFVIVLIALLTIKLMPLFQNISTEEGRTAFKEEIQSLGIKGVFLIVGLMFAQIFLAILPGEPVELLAGMCYGPIGGLFVIYLGTFLCTVVILFLVRKFGKDFIYSFVSKEKIEKMENSKLFTNTKRIYSVLFILFFLPGTPKDLITYVGALLPLGAKKFVLISTFARFPSIISSTIVGSNLIDGNWKFMAFVYVMSFVISFLVLIFSNKNNKEIVKEIIKNN